MFKVNLCGLVCFLVVIFLCSSIVGCQSVGGGNNNKGEGEPAGKGGKGGEPFDTETVMLPGGVPLEMVWIPSGTFLMGAYDGDQDSNDYEKPQHQVTLSQGFWMGKYELTQAQWEAVMDTTPWAGRDYASDEPGSPAVYISWNDAQSFITALNTLTSKTFRLPTEAEWEYACRAGTTTFFYWGDDPSNTEGNDYAWWRYNAYDVNEKYAHVVGQKVSNAWGLYDMHGNVWEWCNDWWYRVYTTESVTNPTGPDSGSYRVRRGGSWDNLGNRSRSAFRYGGPSGTYLSIGFRLAK